MKRSKSYRDYVRVEIKRCEETLLTLSGERHSIASKHLYSLKQTLKQGIPEGDNSIYAPIQDDDTVQFSTG